MAVSRSQIILRRAAAVHYERARGRAAHSFNITYTAALYCRVYYYTTFSLSILLADEYNEKAAIYACPKNEEITGTDTEP